MPLSSGTRLGPYEIQSPLGEGGMGEVYRARDTRLGRSVAIKVLPEELADDPDRISRFEREARSLASLNHPNIATLYGLEAINHGTHRLLLVMELVEGETLEERLRRGPLALEPALVFARQIADALESAHEKGLVHRDLKPANVKITPDDQVKLLDFGLAKAFAPEGDAISARVSDSPTMQAVGTQAGVIVGTAAYMSPEQARGLAADHRSDIFSFGVLLFEMLTARRMFEGQTLSDVLAGVIARDADLAALPPAVNPRLPDLIRRCVDKSPKKRWQAIGDVRAELEIISRAPRAMMESAALTQPTPVWKYAVPAVALALIASAITGVVVWRSQPAPSSPGVTRFSVPLPDSTRFIGMQRPTLALSSDGRMLVFVAGPPVAVYVRSMDSLDTRVVKGTEGQGVPTAPVFSPDGQAVAYWSGADQSLKRVPVSGGAPVTLCQTELTSGLTWSPDGIVFANTDGVNRVSAEGGHPELLVKAGAGEIAFGPQMLPGGRALLLTLADATGGSERWDSGHVVVQTLPNGERHTLIEGGSDARYVASGHIVFARSGVVYAAPFDVATLRLTGREVPVIEGVMRGTGTYGSGTVNIAVSSEGTLAYLPGPLTPVAATVALALFDSTGKSQPLALPPGSYQGPRISPDGRHIALVIDDGKDVNVWVYDVGSDRAPRRLTFDGSNRSVAWSANSQRVAFRSDREGAMAIYWAREDGSGAPERLTAPEKNATDVPDSFSSDGAWMLFDRLVGGRTQLWVYSLGDRRARRFRDVESLQLTGAVFSPDGKWVAYASRARGRSNQVFVEPFPPTGTKYQASSPSEDAHHPVWSPDGKELYYTPGPGNRLIHVPVTFTPSVSFGTASTIERPFSNFASSSDRPFDIMGDGQHFLGVTDPLAGTTGIRSITVVLNWFEELKAKAPAGR